VNQQESQVGGPTDGVALSATVPYANWPGIAGGLDDQSTVGVAGLVQDEPGGIGAVQAQYAKEVGFEGTNPSENVALVENASGEYTAPIAPDVTSALAYATPEDNGSQDLNFNGLGPNVYNPSTFSYLLTPTTGSSSTDGQTMSAFVNYALALGQQIAPGIGYASLGEPLDHFGINEVAADLPGQFP
jgi:phosphate transport system substrate-binding protein